MMKGDDICGYLMDVNNNIKHYEMIKEKIMQVPEENRTKEMFDTLFDTTLVLVKYMGEKEAIMKILELEI